MTGAAAGRRALSSSNGRLVTPLQRSAARVAAGLAIFAFATACGAIACGRAAGGPPAPARTAPAGLSAPVEPAPDDLGAIMLHIENRGFEDVLISVVRGSIPERLVRVSAANRWSGALDKWIEPQGGQIRLLAERVGTRTYGPEAALRQQLTLKPGQSVVWTIEKELKQSFLEVR